MYDMYVGCFPANFNINFNIIRMHMENQMRHTNDAFAIAQMEHIREWVES